MTPESAREGSTALREGGPPMRVTAPPEAPPSDRPGAPVPAIPSPPVTAVFAALESSPRGLTRSEAATRRARCRPNALPGAGHGHVWQRLVAQFTDLFAVVLLVSSASGSPECTTRRGPRYGRRWTRADGPGSGSSWSPVTIP